MRRRIGLGGAATALLAGCVAAPRAPTVAAAPPVALNTVGLERVMGQDAAGLIRLLGRPDADTREGPGRRLQFASQFCVLDAYLYPKGSGEPHVTWVDAREPDGSGIDRASCVAALLRRDAAPNQQEKR